MKLKAVGLVTLLSCSSFVFSDSNQELETKLNALKKQAISMDSEIKALEKKVYKDNKKSNKKRQVKRLKRSSAKSHFHNVPVTVHSFDNAPSLLDYHPSALMVGDHVLTYIAGTPVVTSPYLGERPAFDGSDLIINISSINQDVRLMAQRMLMYNQLEKGGYDYPETPIIALSGSIESYGAMNWPINGPQTGDFNLAGAELDVAIALNSWVEGLMTFSYDSSAPATPPLNRVSNSNFRLGKGFINVGNLEKTPFYMTAGQIYVPFGRYSSSMVSAPMTLGMARTKTRPFVLGYREHVNEGFFGALYGFKSDTTLDNSAVGGINLGYDLLTDKVRGQFSVGYISNIGDSEGMQNTSQAPALFQGFAASVANENMKHVPAFDINAYVLFGQVGLTAEWVTVTEAFRTQDLTYNNQGAKPQAANFEVSYSFKGTEKPASVALGYGFTKEALALGLPKQRISAVYNTSWWRDTIQSIEYRHDIAYGSGNTAGGRGVGAASSVATGGNADTVTAQFGLYF